MEKIVEGDFIKYYNEDGTCTMIKSLYTKEQKEELDNLKGPLYGENGPLTSYGFVIIDPSEEQIKALEKYHETNNRP